MAGMSFGAAMDKRIQNRDEEQRRGWYDAETRRIAVLNGGGGGQPAPKPAKPNGPPAATPTFSNLGTISGAGSAATDAFAQGAGMRWLGYNSPTSQSLPVNEGQPGSGTIGRTLYTTGAAGETVTPTRSGFSSAPTDLSGIQDDWLGTGMRRYAKGTAYVSPYAAKTQPPPPPEPERRMVDRIGSMFGGMLGDAVKQVDPNNRKKQIDDEIKRQGMKRGTSRVTGHGNDPTKDTIPAMLAPGEAVLNAGAAQMMGRKKIAALNKRGLKEMAREAKTQKLMEKGEKPEWKDGAVHASGGVDFNDPEMMRQASLAEMKRRLQGVPNQPVAAPAQVAPASAQAAPRLPPYTREEILRNASRLPAYTVTEVPFNEAPKAVRGAPVRGSVPPELPKLPKGSLNAAMSIPAFAMAHDEYKAAALPGFGGIGGLAGLAYSATKPIRDRGATAVGLPTDLGAAARSKYDQFMNSEAMPSQAAPSMSQVKSASDANTFRNADRVVNKAAINPDVAVPAVIAAAPDRAQQAAQLDALDKRYMSTPHGQRSVDLTNASFAARGMGNIVKSVDKDGKTTYSNVGVKNPYMNEEAQARYAQNNANNDKLYTDAIARQKAAEDRWQSMNDPKGYADRIAAESGQATSLAAMRQQQAINGLIADYTKAIDVGDEKAAALALRKMEPYMPAKKREQPADTKVVKVWKQAPSTTNEKGFVTDGEWREEDVLVNTQTGEQVYPQQGTQMRKTVTKKELEAIAARRKMDVKKVTEEYRQAGYEIQ